MPRDAVSRTAIVERNGGHKWVKLSYKYAELSEWPVRGGSSSIFYTRMRLFLFISIFLIIIINYCILSRTISAIFLYFQLSLYLYTTQ